RLGRLEDEIPRFGDAPAQDEALGVEHRGKVGQPLTQPVPERVECRLRDRIALLRRLGDVLPRDALRRAVAEPQQDLGVGPRLGGPLARVADQGTAAGVLLPAAALAATALA